MGNFNAKIVCKKILKNMLMFLLIVLTACKNNYPIVAYDTDLTKEERNKIIQEYEKQLAYRENIRKENENSSEDDEYETARKDLIKISELNTYIDEDYIEYENNSESTEVSSSLANDKNNSNNSNINISDDKTFNDFPVVILFKNQPDFDLTLYKPESFETYSELDSLGRVGKAEAMIGKETMPTTGRESIGMIKPTGWQTVKYDNIDGKYLYNRCHLIGWQLSAENKNEKNLFTGTRYLNVKGMLPFENQVANYIKTTGNHVLYRVTPYYSGNNLLVSHVQIEALSFEDKGAGICFNVKLDNIQPGIHINYADGSSNQEVSTNS